MGAVYIIHTQFFNIIKIKENIENKIFITCVLLLETYKK